MKTQVNTPVKGAKNVTTKNVVSEAKPAQSLNYKSDVLQANKLLKQESKTLGFCIKTLLSVHTAIGLNATMLGNLQTINTDSETYKRAAMDVRKTKSGNYSAFYLLQYLYKISK